ncbi:skin secretory protein xP2-like isoform X1 [Falco peregrinus]|uniref:skin secretory protein xP2-like isoform X1 n=1 Tax=Falco peregrinus TaxID=8954 RepID=UPI002478EE8C|nr:skin secretory protein xP2-like isoform X1 [Falco peregrinus]XP_055658753.1 skin secretory protein xP2-like isoform X1 [Falco peregrinus]
MSPWAESSPRSGEQGTARVTAVGGGSCSSAGRGAAALGPGRPLPGARETQLRGPRPRADLGRPRQLPPGGRAPRPLPIGCPPRRARGVAAPWPAPWPAGSPAPAAASVRAGAALRVARCLAGAASLRGAGCRGASCSAPAPACAARLGASSQRARLGDAPALRQRGVAVARFSGAGEGTLSSVALGTGLPLQRWASAGAETRSGLEFLCTSGKAKQEKRLQAYISDLYSKQGKMDNGQQCGLRFMEDEALILPLDLSKWISIAITMGPD